MRMLLAQATGPCGDPADPSWLCQRVLEATDNALLARLAGLVDASGRAVTVLVVAFIVSRLLRRLVTRFGQRMEQRLADRLERAHARGSVSDTQRFRLRRGQRLQAATGVLRGVVGTVVWVTAILVALSELGVSLQPVLAGAGLAGILIGFGAQQLVRDVLAGIAILIEDQFGVGDWIEVDGKVGEVERVGLRATAFRDVDGIVHHVLNGSIQRVGNLSQEWARSTFDVPLALDADIPAAKAIIFKVATDLVEDPVWRDDIIGPPEIWGVQEFGPRGLSIRVVIPTRPLRNWDVTRQLRERLKLAFEQAGVRMPSQLVEIGGQRFGYAVLQREIAEDEPGRPPSRRSLVPPDVGPLDRPFPQVEVDRDETAELRIEQGPLPRPD
jgi:moderate conductance mechanosensitive channel